MNFTIKKYLSIAGLLVFAVPVLVSAHEVSWPGKRLAKLLPQADNFKQKQTTLTAAQVAELESNHDIKLGTEDRAPIFYFAYGKADKATGRPPLLGIVIFIDAVGEYGPIEISAAMDPNGTVRVVDIWEQSDTKRIEDKEFLAQFIGKTRNDAFKIGEDVKAADGAEKSSQAVASGIKRGLLLIHSVFEKH